MGNCLNRPSIKVEKIDVYPSNFHSVPSDYLTKSNNRIRTTKYRFYNFIFLNLFEQFKRYSNLFFIFCVILNFIPFVGVFAQGTAIIPVLFILIVTLIKDGVEDLRRYLSDKNVNNRTVRKYDKTTNEFVFCKWQDIHAGDMIMLSTNERIPADLLLYYSSDPNGICFIETMDIDGETNLKQRSVIGLIDSNSSELEKRFEHLYCQVEAPNKEIYKFNGNIYDCGDKEKVQNLKKSNLILRDTLLRNTAEVRGLVIYAGNETKVFMNNEKARFKRSLLEDQLNIDMLMCLGILIIVCMMTGIGCSMFLGYFNNSTNILFLIPNSTVLNNIYLQGFVRFWTSIIVFQSIIPIALYITLELVKAHQILHITSDLALYNEELDKKIDVKAYNITEDLGQIKHMFCDKTGTLTDNEMIFRKASVSGKIYETEDNSLKLLCKNSNSDKSIHEDKHLIDFLLLSTICNSCIIAKGNKGEKKLVHDDTASTIWTDITSVSKNSDPFQLLLAYGDSILNETIPPVSIEDTNPIPKDLTLSKFGRTDSLQSISSLGKFIRNNKNLENIRPLSVNELVPLIFSESPDEHALVKMVMFNGFKLHQRSNKNVLIWNDIDRKWIKLKICKTLPFDSIRKCMSVIVKDMENGDITLYCKGADSVMFPKMICDSENDAELLEKMKNDVHSFASDGLRTLVMGRRNLNVNEYKKWKEHFNAVEIKYLDNEKEMKEIFDLIETNLTLIGAIGLEDKLQEFVPEILECFKEAGINIWILTGDKKETAISIAFSTRLFSKTESIKEISSEIEEDISKDLTNIREQIEKSVLNYSKNVNEGSCKHEEFGLVIDGCSLTKILESDTLKDEFLNIAYFCNCVVCCRCTPKQKAEVVRLIKNNYEVRTLAIGDGANDVNMIQSADIGIGVSGKEGSQATMASDFAITKFKYLKRLVLVHGHWSYDKLARMSLLMFYKDLIISFVLYFFQILCGFSVSTAIDQVTQVIFHLIQTGCPPLIFGIWDKDFSDEILMANPQIYKTGINSKMYRPRDFWRTVLDSLWQAICIFLIPWLCYRGTEIDMGEFGIVSVTCVVIAMFSHLLIESRHWSPFHWAICLGSLTIGFYLEIFIVNVMCVVVFDCNTDNPYKILHYTLARGKTYVVVLLTTAAALFPRIFVKAMLFESRDSVFYEAHRTMNRMNIPKYTTNILQTRKYDPHIFDFRNSPLYLGNLEKFKKLRCEKCSYQQQDISKSFQLSPGKYKRNEIVPVNI